MSTNQGTVEVKVFRAASGKQDIHRFLLESPAIGSRFGCLEDKLARVYKLDPTEEKLYWKDSEGDYITLSSDDELQAAILNVGADRLLRLYLVSAEANVHEQFTASSAAASASSGVLHPYVTCDGCDGPVRGNRFKCLECPDYDLCDPCQRAGKHPEHNFALIRRPDHACPFMFRGRDRCHGPRPGCRRFPHGMGPWGSSAGSCGATGQTEGSGSAPCGADSPLQMRLGDLIANATRDLPTVLAAVNQALAPLGADLQIYASGPSRDQSTGQDGPAAQDQSSGHDRPTSQDQSAGHDLPTSHDQSAGSDRPASEERATGGDQTIAHDQASGTDSNTNEARATQVGPDTKAAETQHGATRMEQSPQSEEAFTMVDAPSTSWLGLFPSSPQPTRAKDPKVQAALQYLTEMGFDNEGNWLEQLLVAKNGDIIKVLDVLTSKPQ